MNTTLHNKIHNYLKIAAYPLQKSHFRGFSLEAGSLFSKTGRCKASVYSVMLSSCKDCPAHQNREENVNKNVKSKPFLSPAMAPKF